MTYNRPSHYDLPMPAQPRHHSPKARGCEPDCRACEREQEIDERNQR